MRQHLQRLPLRVRLVMIVVLLMLGALAVTSVATATLLRHYLVTRMDQELQQAAALVAQAPFDQLVQRRGPVHAAEHLHGPDHAGRYRVRDRSDQSGR